MTTRVSALSLAHQAGQRLMIGFNGLTLDDELKHYLHDIRVGGLMLFARNIDSPGQVADLCRAVRRYAAEHELPPLFVGIDQEGGSVARLKPPFTQFPGNPHIRRLVQAEHFARITAAELTGIGVNINMAPVLDVADPKGNGIMRARTFGKHPQRVARLGATVIRHMQSNGVLAVAKHFPGIGRTVLDSHLDLPELAIDHATLAGSDLIPFQAAMSAGVAGVMLSHTRYSELDPLWPASLSPAIARDMLRHELGYDGLVLTDDIDMGALDRHFDPQTIATQCLQAQVDLILICHPGPKITIVRDHILHMIQESEETAEAGRRSVERIVRVKKCLPHAIDSVHR